MEAVPDPDRTACLSNGWHAAVCINGFGEETVWLIVPRDWPGIDVGCGCGGCAPHDQEGPLPAGTRGRLWRCRARTSTGHRCSRPAAELGGTLCSQHRSYAPYGQVVDG